MLGTSLPGTRPWSGPPLPLPHFLRGFSSTCHGILPKPSLKAFTILSCREVLSVCLSLRAGTHCISLFVSVA